MSSKTTTLYPIIEGISRAEDILGKNRNWLSQNDLQQRFLDIFAKGRDEVVTMQDILESLVSWNVSDINEFLKKRGFDIKLEQGDGETFYLAAVLELLIYWIVSGTDIAIAAQNQETYEGVLMDHEGLEYFGARSHQHPIVGLHTQSQDLVYMSMLDLPLDGFDLLDKAQELSSTMKPIYDYGDLVFPMVDLNQLVDVSWLLGMRTTAESGKKAKITQAKQQTIIKLNKDGALIKSGFAAAITLEAFIAVKPEHIIDRPFLFWVQRSGLSIPLVSAWIDFEDWKNPGSLA